MMSAVRYDLTALHKDFDSEGAILDLLPEEKHPGCRVEGFHAGDFCLKREFS